MKRVEAAIEKGACVLAFGGRTLSEDPVLAELRRRGGIPAVTLGATPVSPAVALSEESLAPATRGGGLVVLIEPDAGTDGRALEELGKLLKAAKQKPRVHVVARSFNPFLLPMSMRLMKLDQHKTRAKDFMALLPVVASGEQPAAPKKKAKKAKSGPAAPHVQFVGREDSLPALKEALPGGGPLVVLGPSGIGRTWLVEQALQELGDEAPTRLPDFAVFDGSDFDTLAALLAEASGDEEVKKLVQAAKAKPAELIDGLLKGLQAESLQGSLMVFHNLRFLQHPDGSIARRDRLSMLVQRLLTESYAPRIVFVTDRRPALFKPGQTAELPVFEVGGLKGRELYGIFEGYHAGAVERNKMGEAFNLTGGHPMATRALAIGWRNQGDSAIDERKVLKMPNPAETEPLSKLYRRRVEKLPKPLHGALALCAHSRLGLDGGELAKLGLKRDERIELLRRGLLEALPFTEPRLYRVHALVRRQLTFRDISDFDTLETLARIYRARAEKASGVHALAWDQHANRIAVSARRHKDAKRLPYPDDDSTLAAINGILRMRNPRLDLALQMARQVKKRAANDPRAWVAEARVRSRMEEGVDLAPLFAEAREAAPTPELFHSEVNWRLDRRAKGHMARAAEVLAAGREAWPQDGTLARRLGALLQEQGKFEQAEQALRAAIEIEPGAPEAYSRLGEVLIHGGPERWADAENAIEYALQLDGERPVHRYRLARLLRRRAMVLVEAPEATQRAELQARAKELLEEVMKARPREPGPYLELAQLLLEMSSDLKDLERAEWALGKADKIRKTPVAKLCRARILARRGEAERAEAAINRLLQGKHPYQAHAALSELYFAQRKVFLADQELAKAIAMCPDDRLELGVFKVEKARLEALISSGQALEIEKQAEAELTAIADSAAQEVKTTHDRGTVVRRRAGQQVEVEKPAAEAAPAEEEAAPAEEAAPSEPELAQQDAGAPALQDEPAAEAQDPAADQ